MINHTLQPEKTENWIIYSLTAIETASYMKRHRALLVLTSKNMKNLTQQTVTHFQRSIFYSPVKSRSEYYPVELVEVRASWPGHHGYQKKTVWVHVMAFLTKYYAYIQVRIT